MTDDILLSRDKKSALHLDGRVFVYYRCEKSSKKS